MLKPTQLKGRFISDIDRTVFDDQARIEIQFRYMLKLILAFVFITMVLKLITQDFTMAIMLGIFCLVLFGSYWLVYLFKRKGIILTEIILNLCAFSIYSYLLIIGSSDGFSAVWILIMPLVAILLMGLERGAISSLVMFLLLLFFFWTPIGRGLLGHEYSHSFFVHFPFLYIVMFVLVVFVEIMRRRTYEQLLESRAKMELLYNRQYDSLQHRVAEAKRVRHDMRHHFAVINSYLDDEKYDELREYVAQYNKSLPFEESLTFCEHYATNALLTYFSQQAKQDGINSTVRINLPSEIPFAVNDLTIIFGNLLENALEASNESMANVEGFEPDVTVTGNYDGKVLLFQVSNRTWKEAVQNERNQYMSSKHSGVGIGIDSVRRTVEKYDGTFEIISSDHKFTALVMLPVPVLES